MLLFWRKKKMINEAYNQVDEVINYNIGFITIMKDIIKLLMFGLIQMHICRTSYESAEIDRSGFNSVYMMLDSGARGSKEQLSS